MEMNDILERLPRHLMSLVIDQPYNDYTARDHALWRYVMRQNIRYLGRVAHGSYLDGLKRTGISIDRIPHMYGMNRILREIGWAAVAVDGFIPPSAFMEFQAYNVLVIAADIRPIDQVEYTPAPDIIHEAAGHAPIIADPEYAEYLRKFGWVGARAFSSGKDYELYEAIRHLSILKADPYTSAADIAAAERDLADAEAMVNIPSEMARIRNLHWWTVEYGLIGDLNQPKIYGAGLLSSIGESYSALRPGVKKIPYTLDAVNYNFDITTKQPQLFVTPDFAHLSKVLDEFTATMAIQTGGLEGLLKAIDSGKPATCVYSSGLQVSGHFQEVTIRLEQPVYFRTEGPTTLNFRDKVLEGQGTDHHRHGFSSPVGKLKATNTPPELLSPGDLANLGIITGQDVTLEFESGVKVNGRLENILRKGGKNLLMTFSACKMTFMDKILYDPAWGTFDMAVGEKIVSAYSGPADPEAFDFTFPVPREKTHKLIHTPEAIKIFSHYDKIRLIRENGHDAADLVLFWNQIKKDYPAEWLLLLEILETAIQKFGDKNLESEVRIQLDDLASSHAAWQTLINNGLSLAGISYH